MRVLVIDHQSTDRTRDLARAHGAEVIERAFEGFVTARRFAVTHVRTEWTLMIDADEALDATLRDAIAAASAQVNGYIVRRSTFYRGRALRMWRNEMLLRLFRTETATLEAFPSAGGEAQLHERWSVPSPVATLDGELLHDSYPTHEAYAAKYEYYTTIEANGSTPSRVQLAIEAARALPRFAWYLFARGAIADGADGMRIAWLSALYPVRVRMKALRR